MQHTFTCNVGEREREREREKERKRERGKKIKRKWNLISSSVENIS